MILKFQTYITLTALIISCFVSTSYSQSLQYKSSKKGSQMPGYAKEKWTVNDPFEQKVFIENNESQFDGKIPESKGKILFSTRINEVYLYFSSRGLTYRYDKYPEVNSDGKETDEEEKHERKMATPKSQFFSINWAGANQNTSIAAEDEVGFYYTYPKDNKHTTIAHAFKKLLCKSIYPGIDIEYRFPEDKKGLEYSIIVHPGANLAQVKMVYNDAGNIKMTSGGDIESESSFGQFIDHAPVKSYYKDNGKVVKCSFSVKGNKVSYIANYDNSKTLVIDPWMVNPGFTNYNAGYDVCYDLRGNVYAYGSFSPYQEIKINSNGVIKWIYSIPNADPQYADFAVDEATGISYDGSCTNPTVYKVDTSGLQTGSYFINNTMEELWRMAFNKCENHLILAGGGVGLTNQACTLDTGLVTLHAVNVLNTGAAHHDMSLLTIDNDNSSVYMATALSDADPSNFNNTDLRCMLPNLTPTNYIVSDGLGFTESCCDANYIDGVGGHSLAMNGAVTSPNWLYFYDGATLKRYNKSTGAIISTKTISATQYTWGGLDVDLCDNMYLGKTDTIMVYDSSLINIGHIIAPNTVYDLHVAPNNILVASGLHFVSSFAIVTNPLSISFNTALSHCVNGTAAATAHLNGCGNDSSTYSYQWSNGATNQTVTGLSQGTYTVLISSACDFVYSDTVKIGYDSIGGMTIAATESNEPCYGDKLGSTIASVSGGSGPYTYLWAPVGGTNSLASNLSAGTYTVSVKDFNGCLISDSVHITQPPKISLAILGNDSICSGASEILTASGGGTYLWNNSATTSSISVTENSTQTYSCTVTLGGCSADTSITVYAKPNPIIRLAALHDTICLGDSAILSASGGGTYLWNNSATSSSISVDPLVNTTYSVKVSKNGCSKDTDISVIVNKLSPTINGPFTICLGDTIELKSSGGGTYRWSTGSTTSNIFVTPPSTFTYSVTIRNGVCVKDTSVKVTVNPLPVISISGNSVICKGDTATLNGTGGGTYKWSTGQTSSNINVNPSVTSVYTLTVTNSFGCKADSTFKVGIILPDGVMSGPNSICPGDSIRLTAKGGGTYLWSTGATTSYIYVNATKATNYYVIVNNGCIDTVSKNIFVDNPGLYVCCDTTVTSPGTPVVIDASGAQSYYWLPPTGVSCDSCPNPTVTPTVTTTYTVIGTDSAGCKLERIVTIDVSECFIGNIPNVFTPNGDGVNDEFYIYAESVSGFSISIYDRWGKEMYESTNPNVYWSGKNQHDNMLVSAGVYYYIIRYSCYNKSYKQVGYVQVIR